MQERHSRLAAALALSELTQEKDIQAVGAKWGREGFVSKSEWGQGEPGCQNRHQTLPGCRGHASLGLPGC